MDFQKKLVFLTSVEKEEKVSKMDLRLKRWSS